MFCSPLEHNYSIWVSVKGGPFLLLLLLFCETAFPSMILIHENKQCSQSFVALFLCVLGENANGSALVSPRLRCHHVNGPIRHYFLRFCCWEWNDAGKQTFIFLQPYGAIKLASFWSVNLKWYDTQKWTFCMYTQQWTFYKNKKAIVHSKMNIFLTLMLFQTWMRTVFYIC